MRFRPLVKIQNLSQKFISDTELQVLQLVSIDSITEDNKFTDNTAEMKVFNFVHQYCTTRLMAWITRPWGHKNIVFRTWAMGILDYFTLPESHKTKNLLSKFPKGIPNFREGNPQNHAYGIITVYIHNDYSIGMCYDISKKSWRIGIFSPFFLCCFYFLLKVHVNFSLVFYRNYRAVVTSSRHRPFFCHNFVFFVKLFICFV